MQTVKWIEMVRLAPTAAEKPSTFDNEKVRGTVNSSLMRSAFVFDYTTSGALTIL